MGLDLSHCKAVITPVDPHEYYYAEDFPPEAFAGYGFERYLQAVPSWRGVYCANFFDDEISLELERIRSEKEGGTVPESYWLGTPEANDDALRDIERRLNLDRRDASRLTSSTKHEGREYRSTSLWYSERIMVPGIYCVDAGYQRKGMGDAFYEYFGGRRCDFFVREEDFRVLEGSLDPDYRDELLPNLRANFIDNYERGRSFLFVSD